MSVVTLWGFLCQVATQMILALASMLLSHTNGSRRYQSALVDQGPSPAGALTLLDQEASQVLGNYSLGEAGPLDYHDIGVEGGAGDGHLAARHQLGNVCIDSSHCNNLLSSCRCQKNKASDLNFSLAPFLTKP